MSNRKPQEYWEQIISECKASGLSGRKWCEVNNVKITTYQYWHNKIRKQKEKQKDPVWTKISLDQESDPISSKIIIRYSDFSLEVEKGSDMSLLTEILKAMSCLC